MNPSRSRKTFILRLLCLGLVVASIAARTDSQSMPEPTREQLLNGLTVLFSQRNAEPNVLMKLRIRSGAAFDLAGKGGTMALLGDVLFPDPTTREYVVEQLGGQLEVVFDYDAIDITISGNANQFERMVEFLRSALVTTQLTPENIAKARATRIKQMTSNPSSAAEIADNAIAARLFGRFPYGHPPPGSLETMAKVDRADLLFARERFLNPDNATLVVIGGIDKPRAMRALRQLLGQWRKGDQIVPPTFRAPDAPDARVLVVNRTGSIYAEIRIAVRGLARSDRDYPSALLLSLIARDRWRAAMPETSTGFVRHEAHALPGILVIGASAPAASASSVISTARDLMRSLAKSPPSAAELERARSEAIVELEKRSSQTESIAGAWLDIESYNLKPSSDQVNALRSVTAADLQRVAAHLFDGPGVASVVVGNSDQLRTSLGSNIELFVEAPPKPVPVSVTPAKP